MGILPYMSNCTYNYSKRTEARIKILLFALYLLTTYSLRAQEIVAGDSLYSLRFPEQEVPIKDTAYLRQLIKTAEALQNRESDSARALLYKALRYSNRISYMPGIIKGLSGLGVDEYRRGNMDKALKYYAAALKICDTISNRANFVPGIYNNIAIVYHYRGNYNESFKYYLKAIRIRERSGASEEGTPLERLYCNMAALFSDIGEHNKTLFYLKKSEQLAKERQNYNILATVMLNFGSTYARMEDTSKSRLYFLKSVEIAQKNHIPTIEHKCYINLANLSLQRGQAQNAITYMKQASAVKGNILPYNRIAEAATYGNAYRYLKKRKLAMVYIQQALDIAGKHNILADIQYAHSLLSRLYHEQGNYGLAYEHQSKAWSLSDSINNKEKTEAIVRIESSYRSALKDKEIAEKELLISKQQSTIYKRNIWIGIALICLIGAGIFIMILRKNFRHKQDLKDERVQRLIKQQEVKEMKAIIDAEEKERNKIANNLHDSIMIQFSVVKMNMSALLGEEQSAIPKQKIEPLIRQLDAATRSLRKAAHYLMPDMLLENGLAEALNYLCNSLQDDIPFTIRVEQLDNIPRFGEQYELVIYRIVQELLQNVIKHARATDVYIQLSCSGNQLGIDMEDNGIGISPTVSLEYMGLGLKSIKARIQSLNGNIHIRSSDKGTSVAMEFNLENFSKVI